MEGADQCVFQDVSCPMPHGSTEVMRSIGAEPVEGGITRCNLQEKPSPAATPMVREGRSRRAYLGNIFPGLTGQERRFDGL